MGATAKDRDGSVQRSRVGNPAPAPSPYDSKLEEQYAQILEYEKRTGEIKEWLHHPFTLHLSDGKKYRPDFLVTRYDGTLEVIETKGEHKNKRDSITRLHWAAQRFKCFTFRLVWKQGRTWDAKYITA